MRFYCALFALLFATYTGAARADVHVDGYYRQDGTYVQPHYRSNPDSTPDNNWSTQGNINPHTGEEGTRQPSYGGTYGEGSSHHSRY